MVNVYDCNDRVVGTVEYNDNLDVWDGSNNYHGSLGRHLGLTRVTIDGKKRFVLIHGTQWQGEHNWASIISDDLALQKILRSENKILLEKYFPGYECSLEEE